MPRNAPSYIANCLRVSVHSWPPFTAHRDRVVQRTLSRWIDTNRLHASGVMVNFTPRLQLRGGVELTPGFMRSESRDAVRAVKIEQSIHIITMTMMKLSRS